MGAALNKQWQVSGKTVLYRSQLNNQYPYTERKYYFVEPTETGQRGLLQDIYFRNQKNQQLSVNAWLTDNDLIQAPADTIGRERTRTQNYRVLSTYEAGHTTVRAGWFRDVLDYARSNFNNPSHSLTDRFLARIEHEQSLLPVLSVRVGAEGVRFWTRVDGYGAQLITENRADLYALMRYQTSHWLVSANLRQAFVTGYRPPFTPSLGVEYRVVQQTNMQLTAKASIGRSYRVPTLNERYWTDLGNPTLRPEKSLNTEVGLAGRLQATPQVIVTTELTAYRNLVDDWTYWNPTRNYRVENLQQVLARGVEWNGAVNYVTRQWQTGIRASYALTRSTQQRAYDAYSADIIGKQLVYVPVHTGNLSGFIQRGQTRLTIQAVANSKQYITFDNIQSLPAYVLTNIVVNTQLRLGQFQGRVHGASE